LPMLDPQTEARVVINEQAGSIVIDGDIEIGTAIITHKNMVIEAGGAAAQQGGPVASRFVPVDTSPAPPPKLKALVETLNTLKVPTSDVIEIIKGLDRAGKLHGDVIIE
jgi:flagellar P-ring protein precursor FlgI